MAQEATNLLLNTDADVPMTLPLGMCGVSKAAGSGSCLDTATGAIQRFPESCQRSSLADQPEMDDSPAVDGRSCGHPWALKQLLIITYRA